MSSDKATQTSTSLPYYYLYNPLTKQRMMLDQVNDFNHACRIKDEQVGIWEVHVHKQKAKK